MHKTFLFCASEFLRPIIYVKRGIRKSFGKDKKQRKEVHIILHTNLLARNIEHINENKKRYLVGVGFSRYRCTD